MRLFVALEIPAAVRENLSAFVKEMHDLSEKRTEKRVRWVRPENLHLTLKFIGEVADAKRDGIRAALSTIHAEAPIDLVEDVDCALATQGIAREKRSFVPHLTLARFASPVLPEGLIARIQKNSEREFGSFQGYKFHLIESKLTPTGAEYTSIAAFPFTLEA
jgi:2'-5' RNA ligase